MSEAEDRRADGIDAETMGFYDGEARTYADYAEREGRGPWLARFADRLPEGAHVLDLGCGSAWGAAGLAARGFSVDAMDASPGLAAEAKRRHGIEVRVAPFEALDAQALYDGIWASFCLLHDSRAAFPGHIRRIARALKPGGLLYLGLKEGTGAHRDRHGRLYTYFTEEEVRDALSAAGFGAPEVTLEHGISYSGTEDGFLHVLARLGDRR